MSSREIVLWLDERWYQALSSRLKDETVEDKLNSYLDELINQLPERVYKKISGEIWEERQRLGQEIEAEKRYAAFRVTENGTTECFRVEHAVELLDTASDVRRWLRQTEARPFREFLHGRENITAEEFDRMAAGRVEGSARIAGVYDVNLDGRELSAVRPALGWITYRLKDVSTASWHSYRTGSYDRERRQARFMQKLEGREIVSAGRLGAESISPAGEIVEDSGQLNFYLESCFDEDKVFGTRVHTARSDDALNIYANYDMGGGQVCDTLELVLKRADGTDEASTYPLNAVEKAVLLQKMDGYCQQQTGLSLKDYSAQLIAEEMAPPTGPVM